MPSKELEQSHGSDIPKIWDESTMDTQWFCTGVAQPHDKPKKGEDVKPVAFPTLTLPYAKAIGEKE